MQNQQDKKRKRKKRSAKITKECPVCKDKFKTYRSIDQKYCSKDCYTAAQIKYSDPKVENKPKDVEKYAEFAKHRKEFTSEYQPSPQAKKRGWEKRRVKQEIMDMMSSLDELTMAEFEELRKDIEEHPERHTVREARLLRYMTREKFLKDYLDRNTGKAPQDIDITTGGQSMKNITVEHVHRLGQGTDSEKERLEYDEKTKVVEATRVDEDTD